MSQRTCLTCDKVEFDDLHRPYCALTREFVWASGSCERWMQRGKGCEEE